jgi:hypothetical protein
MESGPEPVHECVPSFLAEEQSKVMSKRLFLLIIMQILEKTLDFACGFIL